MAELEAKLSSCMTLDVDSFKETRTNLELLLNRDRLISILRSVLPDEGRLAAIARQSYAHSNGFDKFVLVEQPAFRVRLHIWWPGEAEHSEHIHNHRWDFSSVVMSGELRSQIFAPAEDGEPMYHYRIFPPNPGVAGYNVKLLGQTKLRCVLDTTLAGGSRYTQSHTLYHRVIKNASLLTSTLLLQGPFCPETSDFLTDAPLGGPEQVPITLFTPTETKQKLTDYIAALETL